MFSPMIDALLDTLQDLSTANGGRYDSNSIVWADDLVSVWRSFGNRNLPLLAVIPGGAVERPGFVQNSQVVSTRVRIKSIDQGTNRVYTQSTDGAGSMTARADEIRDLLASKRTLGTSGNEYGLELTQPVTFNYVERNISRRKLRFGIVEVAINVLRWENFSGAMENDAALALT